MATEQVDSAAQERSRNLEGKRSPQLLLFIVFPCIELNRSTVGSICREAGNKLTHEGRLSAASGTFNGTRKRGARIRRDKKVSDCISVYVEA